MKNKNINDLSQASSAFATNTEKMAEHVHQPDIQELLEENLKYAKAIYWSTEKIRRYMFWMRVIKIIWILMVVAPIIFAAIYLPPLLEGFSEGFNSYLDLLK